MSVLAGLLICGPKSDVHSDFHFAHYVYFLLPVVFVFDNFNRVSHFLVAICHGCH